MHCCRQHVQKTLVRIRGKVDSNGRSWRYGAGDFDIQCHFAVRIAIQAWQVLAAINRNRDDLGFWNSKLGEISLQIFLAVSGAGVGIGLA